MLLTGHAASATVIARLLPNPILAFLVGVISHVILDIIPHGDTELIPCSREIGAKMSPENEKKARKMFLVIGLLDATMMLFMFSGIFIELPINFNIYVYALLGTLLIDILDHSFTLLFPRLNRKDWTLSRFHFWIHTIHKKLGMKDPVFRGTIVQIAFIGVILFLNVYAWSS